MLARVVALQLLATAAPAPAAPPPVLLAAADEPGSGPNPPLPRKPGASTPTGATEPSLSQPPAEPAPAPSPETAPAPSATPPASPLPPPPAGVLPPPRVSRARQLSLLSGESLGGASAALAQAGWPYLSLAYAQGLTPEDDLGGLVELDWAKTELRLGAFYRRRVGRTGPLDAAFRLGAAWYADYGGRYLYGSNRADRGLTVAPGLALSQHLSGGILSLLAEAPLTVTVRRTGGVLFQPRLSAAFETPLYGDYTVGVRGGLGYRAGSGDAPLRAGRAELTFLVVGGVRVF